MTALGQLAARLRRRPAAVAPAPPSPEPADPQHQDDDALVARAQQGDSTAFDELVLRYRKQIYGTIYHMTSNHEDANDLAQETFIKAYQHLGRFRRQSSFYTWIHRIAVNHTLNHLKRRRGIHLSLNDLDAEVENTPEYVELMSHVTPRSEVGLNELQEKLNAALQKLSEEHRTVVVMHDVQGMTHVDIAKVIGESPGTVRSRLFYARQQLQRTLSHYL